MVSPLVVPLLLRERPLRSLGARGAAESAAAAVPSGSMRVCCPSFVGVAGWLVGALLMWVGLLAARSAPSGPRAAAELARCARRRRKSRRGARARGAARSGRSACCRSGCSFGCGWLVGALSRWIGLLAACSAPIGPQAVAELVRCMQSRRKSRRGARGGRVFMSICVLPFLGGSGWLAGGCPVEVGWAARCSQCPLRSASGR